MTEEGRMTEPIVKGGGGLRLRLKHLSGDNCEGMTQISKEPEQKEHSCSHPL